MNNSDKLMEDTNIHADVYIEQFASQSHINF